MSVAQLILLALQISIAAIVFSLGLRTPLTDLAYLLRHPGQLARSILAMNLVMPLVAATIVLLFNLRPPLGALLVALALAPVPPMLAKKSVKAGGDETYGMSLFVLAALFSIISIPISVEVVERIFGVPLTITPVDVMRLLATSVVAPLVAGLFVHQVSPQLAPRLAKPISAAAGVLLLLAVLAILASQWRALLAQLGDLTLVAIAIFILMGLVVGHILGGPDPTDRTVLAIASASRHPGVAMGIMHVALPDATGVLPLLLLYLLAGAVLGAPYAAWRKRQGAMPSLLDV